MNIKPKLPSKLAIAREALRIATEKYFNCDAENRWQEFRAEMEHWERKVDELDKFEKRRKNPRLA